MYHALREKFNGDGTVTLHGPCFVTKKPYSVTVKVEQWHAYQNGEKAQDAFKGVSADDREFIISGTSPEGWEQTFGKDEDEI